MVPCVETPPRRRYHTIRFKDGATKTIRADAVSRLADPQPLIALKRGDELVAEFATEDVSGWSLEEMDD